MAPPRDKTAAYENQRARTAARQREIVQAGKDIAGRMRPCENPDRRAACQRDFLLFCETYMMRSFCDPRTKEHWPWADYHLQLMVGVEAAVLHGKKGSYAVPRGGSKSSFFKVGIIWATFYGHRRWACILAATDAKANKIREDLKTKIETNPLLAADFPEIIVPIEALERSPIRQKGQTYDGSPTRIEWGGGQLVIADIPGSAAAQAVISCGGMDAAFVRGQVRSMPDGTEQRPDLLFGDDLQTEDSARSEFQTDTRFELLGAAMEMGPPGEELATLMANTAIRKGDLVYRILDSVEWDSVKVPMLHNFPLHRSGTPADKPHADFWDRYGEMVRDRQQADATALYAAHRCKSECEPMLDKPRDCAACPRRMECMDCEAVVSWRFRKYKADLSAVQHAMNRHIKDPERFAAEMQQEPMGDARLTGKVTPAQVIARVDGLAANVIPMEAVHLTTGVDLHQEIIYYCTVAWTGDFRGWIVDYGTFPEQGARWFRQADPPHPMAALYPGAGVDGVIASGLEALCSSLLRREFARSTTGAMLIGRLMADSRYKPGIVNAVRRKLANAAMWACKGVGIKAERKPIAAFDTKRPGWNFGEHWYTPNVRGTQEFPYVSIDTNFWKSFIHNALSVPVGDKGALALFGTPANASQHQMFADHIANSEYFKREEKLNTVDEWHVLPHSPDNHWFDCLVYAAVAASMLGCKLEAGAVPAPAKSRRQHPAAHQVDSSFRPELG